MTPVSARVTHMLTLPVFVDLLVPPYAQAHNCLEEEVSDDVKRGLVDSRLLPALCSGTWDAVKKRHPSLDEASLLDTLAKAMAKGNRRATPAPERVLDKMSALFTTIDAQVGRASQAAKAALESPQGQRVLEQSIAAAGDFLAGRLLRA